MQLLYFCTCTNCNNLELPGPNDLEKLYTLYPSASTTCYMKPDFLPARPRNGQKEAVSGGRRKGKNDDDDDDDDNDNNVVLL